MRKMARPGGLLPDGFKWPLARMKKKITSPPPRNDCERPALVRAVAWKAIAVIGALVFLMFADVLIAPGAFVLGNGATDMFHQFFSWREFGFGQLSQGNLALWNPHIYGGAPYFGGTQAALLYPTNLLLLFLPLPLAINWSIALNVWLLGVFTYLWAGYRGLKPLACLVAGVLAMFCGPHFLHIYAGHPVNMASMTWAPLLFLAIDGILGRGLDGSARRLAGWWLLGTFAVAMQIFAGHPQYVFYNGITAGLYLLLGAAQTLAAQWRTRRHGEVILFSLVLPGAALAAIFAGGAALAAVQLFTAVQATGETIRSVPLPFAFGAKFSFAPENLITLLSPYFFGDMKGHPYWGRYYLWEMSLFIGVSGLALAVYGAIFGRKDGEIPARRIRILVALAGATFLLALGVHTPIFRVLYDWVPGFDRFRGSSKFAFQTALFLVMLAGTGFDALLRKPQVDRRFVLGVGASGGIVLLMGVAIALLGPADWMQWMRAVGGAGESYLVSASFSNLAVSEPARIFACGTLMLSGCTLLAIAGLLNRAPHWRHSAHAIALIALVETFCFALHTRDTFDSKTVAAPKIAEFAKRHPGDYRSQNLLGCPNSALSLGTQDLWGADPGVVRRYSEFMAWSQGIAPDSVTQYIEFQGSNPLYAMLRFRYAFTQGRNGLRVVESPVDPMDRVQLLQRYRVIASRDAIFSAMSAEGFDPRKEVILEHSPSVEPVASGAPGTSRVTASSTDWLEVEADAVAPSILLVTDVYAPAWRAVALPGSSQRAYDLQPANYILRAVPIAAGHHHLRIEYAPRAFTVGKWVSIGSWLAFLALGGAWLRQQRRRPRQKRP